MEVTENIAVGFLIFYFAFTLPIVLGTFTNYFEGRRRNG